MHKHNDTKRGLVAGAVHSVAKTGQRTLLRSGSDAGKDLNAASRDAASTNPTEQAPTAVVYGIQPKIKLRHRLYKAVVGSTTDTGKVGFAVQPWWRRRRVVWSGVAAVFVLFIGLQLFIDSRHKVVQGVASNTVCQTSLLKQAGRQIDSRAILQLQATTKQVRSLPNYTIDPNCDFILLQYDLLTSNASAAQSDFATFQHSYQIGDGVDSALGRTSNQNPESLDFQVKALKQSSDQFMAAQKSRAQPEGTKQ